MKQLPAFFIFIFTLSSLFSQNFKLENIHTEGFYEPYYFLNIWNENECTFFAQTDILLIQNNTMNIYERNNLTFLKLKDGIIPEFIVGTSKTQSNKDELLILSGIINEKRDNSNFKETITICYYPTKDGDIFSIDFDNYENYPVTFYDRTSHLVENTKEYTIENLNNLELESPWVEAAEGYGIGEGFTMKNLSGKDFSKLLLINGYISFYKPYLYDMNGRIKELKITDITANQTALLQVADTPHPQTLDIPFEVSCDLRIEITDVYPGTKYEDTCLSSLIPFDKEVIPYR